jgi:virginiamycin B lyase
MKGGFSYSRISSWIAEEKVFSSHCISPRTSKPSGYSQILSYYEVPGSNVAPGPITVGNDGKIWFGAGTASGNIIQNLDPKTGQWSNPVSLGQYGATAITATPTGVGFTLIFKNTDGAIGVLKNDSTGLQIHQLSTPGAGPLGIATGWGGELWFTESGAGKIGRARGSTGVIDGDLPTLTVNGSSNPLRITPRPGLTLPTGCSMWFTDLNGEVGRIDVSINELPLPFPRSSSRTARRRPAARRWRSRPRRPRALPRR